MKRIILLTACLITFNYVSQAQEKTSAAKQVKKQETPEVRAQKSVDKLGGLTTLTPEQKTKVYQAALTRAKKSDEIRAKYNGKPEMRQALKAELDVVKKEYRQSVKSYLTPSQLDEVKAKRAAEKKQVKTTKANGNPSADLQNDSDDDLGED